MKDKKKKEKKEEKQKTKSNLLPREIKVDGTNIQNIEAFAKELNKIFTSVGSKLVKNIPNPERKFQDFLKTHN